MKEYICGFIGIIGSAISSLFGGFTMSLVVLICFMVVDFVTGILTAAFFSNSSKTESGKLSSAECWRGIIKKVFTLILVAVGNGADIILGTAFIKDAVAIAFCASELISIIENAGLMGIKIPEALKQAIELLSKKQDKE